MRCHLLTVTLYLFCHAASRYIVVPSVIHSDEISSLRPQCQLNRKCLRRTFLHIGRMTDHLSLILLHFIYCCRLRHLDQSLSAALGFFFRNVYLFFFLYYVLSSYPVLLLSAFLHISLSLFFRLSTSFCISFFRQVGFI